MGSFVGGGYPEDGANLSCGTEEETSVHVLCECEALTSLIYTYLGSHFLYPEDVTNISMGLSGTFVKEQGSSNLVSEYGAQRACFET